jgi:SAM-dependent methyltransferase
MPTDPKEQVRQFWNQASCGEDLYLKGRGPDGFEAQRIRRYELEPYIIPFARFQDCKDLRVLEIGVGLGADHEQFARAGARLSGIDLTPRAIDLTSLRFEQLGLHSDLRIGDAENLPFEEGSFDVVYSWGVIHHSPNTETAIAEIRRVLRPGGEARIMIYSKWSLIGLMLWGRYALLRGRPFRSLRDVYADHLESPGTKAYSVREARKMFASWSSCEIRTVLTHGDLLEGEAGQRHRGVMLDIARKIWPRKFIRATLPGRGLFMLIDARK